VPGVCFGGRRADASDAAAVLGTSEHVALVTLTNSNVTNLDFAFSFSVVTTMRGGDNTDDDTGNQRTVQGSLRQFVQNANGIAGANAMRFVPAAPANAAGSGGSWWRLSVSQLLPVVTDGATTIDGTAYALADGVTPRDDNPGSIAGALTVGTDANPLAALTRPELEIADTGNRNIGLDLRGDDDRAARDRFRRRAEQQQPRTSRRVERVRIERGIGSSADPLRAPWRPMATGSASQSRCRDHRAAGSASWAETARAASNADSWVIGRRDPRPR
jgi:hypothetical protein